MPYQFHAPMKSKLPRYKPYSLSDPFLREHLAIDLALLGWVTILSALFALSLWHQLPGPSQSLWILSFIALGIGWVEATFWIFALEWNDEWH